MLAPFDHRTREPVIPKSFAASAAAFLRPPRHGVAAADPVDRLRAALWAALSSPAVFGSLIPAVTILNAIVGMALPTMMTPREFGSYALVVTLFQYGLIFDLGASQLIDRWIPANLGRGMLDTARQQGQALLWLRLYVALGTLAVAGLALPLLAWLCGLPFSLPAGLLSALAGILYMVALGPGCVYRARSQRRNYALSIAALSAGLAIARPGGLYFGGVVGSFGALAAWYMVFALLFHARMPPRLAARPAFGPASRMIVQGLPFFATSFIWAFYVTGNRWFASALIDHARFGEFAFSANIFSLIIGAAGGFSAFYYPGISERIADGAAYSVSSRLTQDFSRLLLGTTALMAIGIMLAAFLVGHIYPQYTGGVAAARIMLVAVPPLVLASWIMPVSLSNGHIPWIDGLVVFPIATVILGVGVHALYAAAGSNGAAAASTASALPLVGLQLAVLAHARILAPRDAALLFAKATLACAVLAGLVMLVTA